MKKTVILLMVFIYANAFKLNIKLHYPGNHSCRTLILINDLWKEK